MGQTCWPINSATSISATLVTQRSWFTVLTTGDADKGKTKSKGKAASPDEAPEALPQGLLELCTLLPVTAAARDWLEGGIHLQLHRFARAATMAPLTQEQQALLDNPKRKGKGAAAHHVFAAADTLLTLDLRAVFTSEMMDTATCGDCRLANKGQLPCISVRTRTSNVSAYRALSR